jgi:signal transduction histidine kinase/HAMP domain-containing protein
MQAEFGISAQSTGGFDRLLRTRCAFFVAQGRPRGDLGLATTRNLGNVVQNQTMVMAGTKIRGMSVEMSPMTTRDFSRAPNQGMATKRRLALPRVPQISLTFRLFILVLIAIFPAMMTLGYNEYELRKAREADIRQQVVQITKQFGEEIGELREGARQLLLALARLTPVRLQETAACNALFTELKAQYANYSLLAAADTEGRIFCASAPTNFASVADQPFFKRAMAQDGLAVGNYWADQSTGQRMIHFAVKFDRSDGHTGGIVFAGLDLLWLSDHLKERGLSPTSSILVADREGNIVARLPNPEALVGKNMRRSHEAIMDGDKAGWEEAVGVDGVKRIFGYVPPAMPPRDFFLSAGQSKAEAFSAINNATLRGVALIAFGLLAATLAALLGGRRFLQEPIRGLLRAATEWRNGNYDARVKVGHPSSEIGHLGAAFNAMADALASRHEVAQAVSSTLDLRIVLSTILNGSVRAAGADAGAIFRYNRAAQVFRLVDAVGWDATLARSVHDLSVAEAGTAMGEVAARRMPVQIADLTERPSAPLRDATLLAGFRSVLIVPLVGAERILGTMVLQRRVSREFAPETVQLVQTLASQSVLAIQNAQLFREVAAKREQLELANRHKSQFLANMSHELRTPLNPILGYAELLVDGVYGELPDRPRGVVERIQNNGKHLLALINDVLDLAKIEAGQLTLTLEDYRLPDVVQSVVNATEPLASAKGLKLASVVQDNMPMAHGDARRVSQVLLNLVGNAIKFTEEGEVEIRAVAEKGQFLLTVRDTGPGIADADQERIFGEFQQIDNSNTRTKGGTGLGLAISKRMVEMHGGIISVDSVLGVGSTFRVVLPVHVDELVEAA